MPARERAGGGHDDEDVQVFLATLGAALSAIGETVDAVEARLAVIARSYGLQDARFSAFPTFLLLTLGQGKAATVEPTTRLSPTPRLDQIAAVHELAGRAERGAVSPRAGIERLDAIRRLENRFGSVSSVLGYAVLTAGIALILRPAPRDVACAAALGALVGLLRRLGSGRRTLETLMPFLAATLVAAIVALAVKYDVTDPGLRAMIASLVVFIPGVALTTAFLELTEGQMVAGSSRLVWGGTQLGLLAFGIVAGIGMVGVSAERAFSSSDALLGWWAPWLGVLVFAVGVTIAHSAPPGAFPSLLIVLYAAWSGQVAGNELFGAYASGFTGALVMTLAAYLLARRASTMPVYAMFLPGFWLLVPGSLGLIGLTTVLAIPESASAGDVFAIIGSIAAVALGVLCGVELHAWVVRAGGRVRRAGRRGGLRVRRAIGVAPRIAIVGVVVGVFCTWLADGPLTLNGVEGPNNGWLCVLLAGPALLWLRSMERGSWVGVAGVLGCALVMEWTAVENWQDGRRVLDAGVSYGLALVLASSAVLAAVAVLGAMSLVRAPGRREARRGRGRGAAGIVALVLTLLFVVVFDQVLGITQRPSWPPPPDAVTAAGAEAATEAFAARDGTRPHDADLDFAWSTAATIEPRVEGKTFFPRIFADVEAARSSVHILMFGWREGEVGMEMARLLERKLAEGVEVRVLVDAFGSRPNGEAREMFTGLAAAGAQIVVNDVLPLDRDGLYPDERKLDRRQDEVGRADHRKLYVVDGKVAWTGGAGIEDHFENGGFHDVMVRVTGAVVLQAQAAFLTSFRGHGGPLPADLGPYFPETADPGEIPVALAQVIPGGFVAASQAIREQIDGARRRLDVMNPYLTDRDMLERILAAARRGVRVRIVVSETSNNAQASAALRHRYGDLLAAGVEIWEVPGTVVHAKVVVADDTVSFGTVNLDSWALYRNSEIAMIARSAETAELFEQRLFEPDIARSHPGAPPSGAGERIESWLWDTLTYFL